MLYCAACTVRGVSGAGMGVCVRRETAGEAGGDPKVAIAVGVGAGLVGQVGGGGRDKNRGPADLPFFRQRTIPPHQLGGACPHRHYPTPPRKRCSPSNRTVDVVFRRTLTTRRQLSLH